MRDGERVPLSTGEATAMKPIVKQRRKPAALVTDERVPGCECGDYDEPGDACDTCGVRFLPGFKNDPLSPIRSDTPGKE